MEAKHTPEPWEVTKCARGIRTVIVEPTRRMAVADVVGRGCEEEIQANAARIVACVNACEGIPDPSVVGELVELLRELLDNSAAYASAIEADHGYDMERWEERARAALAKATQGE